MTLTARSSVQISLGCSMVDACRAAAHHQPSTDTPSRMKQREEALFQNSESNEIIGWDPDGRNVRPSVIDPQSCKMCDSLFGPEWIFQALTSLQQTDMISLPMATHCHVGIKDQPQLLTDSSAVLLFSRLQKKEVRRDSQIKGVFLARAID